MTTDLGSSISGVPHTAHFHLNPTQIHSHALLRKLLMVE